MNTTRTLLGEWLM